MSQRKKQKQKRRQPENLQQPEQRVAAPSITGVRQVWQPGSVSAGLSPQRLAQIFAASANGDLHDMLTLAIDIEERDTHYAAVLGARRRAVEGLEVIVDAVSDREPDQQLAQQVERLVAHPNFSQLQGNLLDGLGKGFAVTELTWHSDDQGVWWPRYHYCDPRHFLFDRETGQELRLIDEQNVLGIPLQPYRFITHIPTLRAGLAARNGLARLVAIAHMCKSWVMKDWLAYVDLFGIPLRVGRYGPNATSEQVEVLKTAVINLASDAGCVIPESTRIEFLQNQSGSGGENLFQHFAEFLNKEISKAVLGQTMTTEDGASYAQASVHNDVRMDVTRADARDLANTLNAQLIRPFIQMNFGAQTEYPQITLHVPEPEDTQLLVEAVAKLVPLGLEVEQSVLRNKLGLPDPELNQQGEPINRLLHIPPTAEPPPDTEQNAVAELNAAAVARNPLQEIRESALSDWQPLLKPMLNPVLTAVHTASNLEEVQHNLQQVVTDLDDQALIENLATALFQAQAEGDAGGR